MNVRCRLIAVIAVGCLILLPWVGASSAATEEEIIRQGKRAIEEFSDCNEGYRILQRMPASGRKNSIWVLSMARAAECLKQYEESLIFYRMYNRISPEVPEILKKMAEMNCRLDWEARERYGDHRHNESANQSKIGSDACSADSEDTPTSEPPQEANPSSLGRNKLAQTPAMTSFDKMQTPPKRIQKQGYSLVPPNEKGWFIVGGDAYAINLAKQGKNSDETFVVQAQPFKLPAFNNRGEFVRLVKEGQANDTNPTRFKIVKQEVIDYPMKGTECAKSHLIAEDNAAVKISGKSGYMLLEMLSLYCVLPIGNNIGISITYSHRYYPGQSDSSFVEKATNILNSVEFTEQQKI